MGPETIMYKKGGLDEMKPKLGTGKYREKTPAARSQAKDGRAQTSWHIWRDKTTFQCLKQWGQDAGAGGLSALGLAPRRSKGIEIE